MFKCAILSFLLLLNPAAFGQKSANIDATEISQKSEFILDLIDNVEWPPRAISKGEDTLTVSIVGKSPLKEELSRLAEAKSTDKRKIEIRTVSVDDDLSSCQIVFLSGNDRGQLAKLFKKISGLPILTVSDVEGFFHYGVMIELLESKNEEDSKIDFAVNKMVLRDAGLKIHEKFLKKAKKTIG